MRPRTPTVAREMLRAWTRTNGPAGLDILRAATILRIRHEEHPDSRAPRPVVVFFNVIGLDLVFKSRRERAGCCTFEAVASVLGTDLAREMDVADVRATAKGLKRAGFLVPRTLSLGIVSPRKEVLAAIRADDEDLIRRALATARDAAS